MSHRPYGTVEAVWTWRPGLRFAPASTPTHKDRVQGTPAWAIFVLSLREDGNRMSERQCREISTDALFT